MLTSLPKKVAFESSLKPPPLADDEEKELQTVVCDMILFMYSYPTVEETYIDWGEAYIIVYRKDIKDGVPNAKKAVLERYYHMLQQACTSER